MISMKEFGKLIITKRKEAKLTQEAFALRLGITPQAVSKWETGTGYPDITLFPLIAEVLNISIESLFGENEKRTIAEFPSTYRDLPFICSFGNTAVYSSKNPETIDKDHMVVHFTDSSRADANSATAYNYGPGEIAFLEFDQALSASSASASELIKKLDDFKSVNLSVSFRTDVEIKNAEGGAARIEAFGSPRFIQAIKHSVTNDTLNICISTNNNRDNDSQNTLFVYVNFKEGQTLNVAVNGAGKYKISPSFEDTSITVNGCGDVELQNSKAVKIRINGSGDVSCNEINGESDILINGSGAISINETNSLKSQINGCGDIKIGKIGQQAEIIIRGSGYITASGEIEKLICKTHGSGTLNGKNLIVRDAEIITEGSGEVHIEQITNSSVERIGKNGKLYVKKRGN